MDKKLIRNFSIIAHIDHGKSTLADRILEITNAIDIGHSTDQVLDDMELERERGITIKSSAVRLNYKGNDGADYILNLIDTPGHVDFTYEVSKSIHACEGAVLVVDATQGVEAQTLANFHIARERNVKIIPVINKIDIVNIDLDLVLSQMVDILGFKEEEIILASAKEGTGVKEILDRIVKDVPAPQGNADEPTQALIFDSFYDTFKGVVVYVKIVNGSLKPKDKIILMHEQKEYEVESLEISTPDSLEVDSLSVGEVGSLTANIRQAKDITVGDTITCLEKKAKEPLAGYRKIKPLVFCGIYPVNAKDFGLLRQALEKLHLNDASFVYEPENSSSCGFGFRCGFLGLLHMEIVQERLEREYNLDLILTAPNVVFRCFTKNKELVIVDNISKLPEPQMRERVEEPFIRMLIVSPKKFMDKIYELAKTRRGIYKSSEYLGEERLELIFEMPLAEVIVDFYDQVKSVTKGYGSIDYDFIGYRPGRLEKLDVMINGQAFDSFSQIVHKDKASQLGKKLVMKLKEFIPRQLFEIRVQAAIGSHIVASERLSPLGKNVTSKCYGGDITRKRKLWEKQKQGKKRLKQFGKIQIPQEAFLAAIKIR
ncbi:MAG: translation elongation factor 4 [Candidatus Omnitrophica bacterium]|nr:translation elongation factor 4 [Candidatus Omnitrophota bacterium]